MATLNELETAPDSIACGEIPADAPHLGLAPSEETADETVADSESIAEAAEHSDLLLSTSQRRDSKLRRIGRGLLKPLLIVGTAQYALVTVLAGLSAYAVASNASRLVNASLEPIIAALKRL